LTGEHFGYEPPSGLTHRLWGILLDKVRTLHGQGLLIGPCAAKLALRPDQEASRFGIDE
jgi:hypothetical protein